jgi:predicted site-specific integrase-resolvase
MKLSDYAKSLGISYYKRDNDCHCLKSQAERLTQYALAKGYQIKYIVKEVGSGVNDNRKKLIDLLNKDDYSIANFTIWSYC